MDMIVAIKRNTWTVHGIEIGKLNSSFENCYITQRDDMTEKDVIQEIQADYINKGYVVTSAVLYEEEFIYIDLLNKAIIENPLKSL